MCVLKQVEVLTVSFLDATREETLSACLLLIIHIPRCITPSREGFLLVKARLGLDSLPWYPSWHSSTHDGEFIFPQCCWGISWAPCWCQWGFHLVEQQTKQREVTFLTSPRLSSFVSVYLFGTLDTSAYQSWIQSGADWVKPKCTLKLVLGWHSILSHYVLI